MTLRARSEFSPKNLFLLTFGGFVIKCMQREEWGRPILIRKMIMTDVYANIQAGKYENTVKWPVNTMNPDDPAIFTERKSYRENQRLLEEMFYVDCCDELGIDPKAASSEKLFSKAWEDGHAYGYTEVYNKLVDLDAFVNEWAGLRRSEDAELHRFEG